MEYFWLDEKYWQDLMQIAGITSYSLSCEVPATTAAEHSSFG